MLLQVRGANGSDCGHVALQQHFLRQQLLRVARPRRHLFDVVILVEPAAHGDDASTDCGVARRGLANTLRDRRRVSVSREHTALRLGQLQLQRLVARLELEYLGLERGDLGLVLAAYLGDNLGKLHRKHTDADCPKINQRDLEILQLVLLFAFYAEKRAGWLFPVPGE